MQLEGLPSFGHGNCVPGICKVQLPDDFLDELEVKYSQSQLLKEKEVDVFKYFCEFV